VSSDRVLAAVIFTIYAIIKADWQRACLLVCCNHLMSHPLQWLPCVWCCVLPACGYSCHMHCLDRAPEMCPVPSDQCTLVQWHISSVNTYTRSVISFITLLVYVPHTSLCDAFFAAFPFSCFITDVCIVLCTWSFGDVRFDWLEWSLYNCRLNSNMSDTFSTDCVELLCSVFVLACL